MTADEIVEEYPHLKKEDVFAAIEYAEKVIDKEEIEGLKISK
jgi:uncharacterized protein (DUF433 family)